MDAGGWLLDRGSFQPLDLIAEGSGSALEKAETFLAEALARS